MVTRLGDELLASVCFKDIIVTDNYINMYLFKINLKKIGPAGFLAPVLLRSD